MITAHTCRRLVMCIGVAALLGAAGGCDGKKADVAPVVSTPRPVKTFRITAPQTTWERSFSGTVQANDSAQLAFLVAGRLIDYPVNDGQVMKKGEVIGKLDPRDFQNQVDAAQAVVDAAQTRLEKLRKAHEKNAVSQIEVIEQEATYRSAVARLKIAKKALADTVLTAPYDGIVARTLVNQFEDINAAQPVALFQDSQTIELEIAIPEQDLVHANVDNPGKFIARYHALPDRSFDLKFKEVATQADAVTQTYMVGLTMPVPNDAFILPGMTAEVTWVRDMGGQTEPADLHVPVAATFEQPNGDVQVWVIHPETMVVAKRRVQLGALAHTDMVQIVDGLADGDLIAAAGVHHLQEGMTVRRLDGPSIPTASR